MATETTHLNDTIGTIPPEARGCSDLRTVQEMGKEGNSSIYDKSLDKSRCYTPDQIRYSDGKGAKQPLPASTPSQAKPMAENPVAAWQSMGSPSSFTWKKAKQLVTVTRTERPFLLALIGILFLFIIIKLAKNK